MAKYRLGPKDILEKKLSRENPRLNYNQIGRASCRERVWLKV